MVMID